MKKLKIKTAFSLKLYSKFDTGIIKGTRHCNRTSNGHTKKWYHENSDPIWYHLHNIENIKNTHGGVLLLVELQAKGCNFTKSNTPPWVIFTL